MDQKLTEISSIGEFGLIDRITREFPLVNASSLLGAGDDAAVMRYADTDVLVTTDMLLEGPHICTAQASGLQISRGQLQRHIRNERHTPPDCRVARYLEPVRR